MHVALICTLLSNDGGGLRRTIAVTMWACQVSFCSRKAFGRSHRLIDTGGREQMQLVFQAGSLDRRMRTLPALSQLFPQSQTGFSCMLPACYPEYSRKNPCRSLLLCSSADFSSVQNEKVLIMGTAMSGTPVPQPHRVASLLLAQVQLTVYTKNILSIFLFVLPLATTCLQPQDCSSIVTEATKIT